MAARFVLDNSVAMAWCFDDESDQYALAVLDGLQESEAIVPAIWPLEAGNALLVAERRKRLDRAGAARFLAMLTALPIMVDLGNQDRMFKDILTLAREYGLSTYDSSYLDLAMRLGVPLASSDRDLLKAARRCGVPRYHPA